MVRCVSRLAAACLIALMVTSAESQYQTQYSTGFTGDDCTGCGYYWPWSPTCRWGSPFEVQSVFEIVLECRAFAATDASNAPAVGCFQQRGIPAAVSTLVVLPVA